MFFVWILPSVSNILLKQVLVTETCYVYFEVITGLLCSILPSKAENAASDITTAATFGT
jgi:hypothetical protein